MYSLTAFIIKVLNYFLGKGYGSISIHKEVYFIKKLNPKASVFIDVGGNIGDYSQELLENFKVGELHIFEPSKKNYLILLERFKNHKKVKINNLALSHVSKKQKLFYDKEGSGMASLTKRNLSHLNLAFDDFEMISTNRFDSYWEIYDYPIDFMKIDVEGHEMDVLKSTGLILRKIKIIQFEFGGCNIDTGTFFRDFYTFFSKNNFKIYRISPFKLIQIENYKEVDEFFVTTNFIAVNQDLV